MTSPRFGWEQGGGFFTGNSRVSTDRDTARGKTWEEFRFELSLEASEVMPIDYHTHSFRCGHATGTMEEYIEAAAARGLDEIGLSDHLYLYFQPPAERSLRWAMPEADFPAHYEHMLELREHYDPLLTVRVAVEADYVPSHESDLRSILGRYDFDYVLGGVHFLDDWMIDDVDQSERYQRERVSAIYRRYYAVLRQAIASRLFDVIAHFDLPKKFGHVPEEDVRDEVAETLDLAREAGVAVEVSTAGLRKPVAEIYPSEWILGEIARREIPVVLSSDAHAPHEVAHGYGQLMSLIRRSGIEKLATFRNRQLSLRPL